MNRVVALLIVVLVAMAAFIVTQALKVPARPVAPVVTAAPHADSAGAVSSPGTARDTASLVDVRESSLPAPKRDLAEIQRRLASGEAGTYIREILLQRDDNIARWPDRQTEPLRVWIQPTSALPDFHASYPVRAREAFERWMHAGVPVSYVFVIDSARADIPVIWIDHFDMPITGRTKWTRDQHWWIVGSSIEIALHHQNGGALDPEAIHAIALHEVGHVLGLDHTSDEKSIMAARVRVAELSDSDEHTAQLVYSLPPGSVVKP
jgi:hypothetical protein